jgi:hypothetical protein
MFKPMQKIFSMPLPTDIAVILAVRIDTWGEMLDSVLEEKTKAERQ